MQGEWDFDFGERSVTVTQPDKTKWTADVLQSTDPGNLAPTPGFTHTHTLSLSLSLSLSVCVCVRARARARARACVCVSVSLTLSVPLCLCLSRQSCGRHSRAGVVGLLRQLSRSWQGYQRQI